MAFNMNLEVKNVENIESEFYDDLNEYLILENSKPATQEWTEELIEYED